LIIRAIIAVFVLAASSYVVWTQAWPGLRYFLKNPPLLDLGDLRELAAQGKRQLDPRSDAFVRVKGLMVTHRAESSRYNYFWSPLFNIMVRTARSVPPSPPPSDRIVDNEIPAGLEFLVEQRKVFPEDFSVSFDAEGWLMHLRDAPQWNGPVGDYVRDVLNLSDSEIDAAYMLLDGEAPRLKFKDAAFLLAGVVLSALSLLSAFLAWRTWRRTAA